MGLQLGCDGRLGRCVIADLAAQMQPRPTFIVPESETVRARTKKTTLGNGPVSMAIPYSSSKTDDII